MQKINSWHGCSENLNQGAVGDEARRDRSVRRDGSWWRTGARVRARPASARAAGRLPRRPPAHPRERRARSRPARWSLHAAARQGTVPLHICAQGGGALLADRGDAIVALGPPALRAGRGAGRAARRRGRGVELRRRARSRSGPAARGFPALESADPGDPRGAALARTRQRQGARASSAAPRTGSGAPDRATRASSLPRTIACPTA